MKYGLTDEQASLRKLVRKLAEDYVRGDCLKWDMEKEFPKTVVELFAKSGLFSVNVESVYGGLGEDLLSLCLVAEELSRVDGGIATTYLASHLGVCPVARFGTEEQKKKYLTRFSKVNGLYAFGLTEANAGSDVSAISTTAEKKGDYYEINGSKQFISNGGEAEYYTVFAQVPKSGGRKRLSVFIVEKGTEGFTFGKIEDKLGIRNSVTRELIFNNCKVHKDNLLGNVEGNGLRVALKTFDETRIVVAAQALGIAQGALEQAIAYTNERKQFGKKISTFQGLQWMIADMVTKVEAARSFVYSAAKAFKEDDKYDGADSCAVKVFASDIAVEVTNLALQLLGGYGYLKEYGVEKHFRDAKITQLYEGTNQVLRNSIALSALKRN